MSKFFLGKQFKQLEKEWQKKLEQNGFKDIEILKNGQRLLRQSAGNVYRHVDERTRISREQYFQSISYHTAITVFPKILDGLVMHRYADGKTIKIIVEELARENVRVHRQTIRFIIRRYEHEWGIRYWTLKERNLLYG